MKILETLIQERAFEHERSYVNEVGLMLQPQAQSHFKRHPEFDEVFRRYTQRFRYNGLDLARLWAMALNCNQALTEGAGSVAELGVYQ